MSFTLADEIIKYAIIQIEPNNQRVLKLRGYLLLRSIENKIINRETLASHRIGRRRW